VKWMFDSETIATKLFDMLGLLKAEYFRRLGLNYPSAWFG